MLDAAVNVAKLLLRSKLSPFRKGPVMFFSNQGTPNPINSARANIGGAIIGAERSFGTVITRFVGTGLVSQIGFVLICQ